MLNWHSQTYEYFTEELKNQYFYTFGQWEPEYGNALGWIGHMAFENMANADTLYHNTEHAMMVTMAGQQILRGKQLSEGGIEPRDWLHFIVALLCHDIGFVWGICQDDTEKYFCTGFKGEVLPFPKGATCASLNPYHVERGKLFIRERFQGHPLVDAEVVSRYIEMTRFPIPDDDLHKDTAGYGGLVRASDLIGQLGDPHYLRKIPGLFYEFEEQGANAKMGYKTPDDMRVNFAKFFWGVVNPYIQDALEYLKVTQEGKQWIANLYAHVFAAEHRQEFGMKHHEEGA
jgi:hypothetical protein